MIQITGDPSAERTAPPRSTHVRLACRLLLLDPARGKERLMKIQQHDGVVVDAAGIRQASAGGRGVARGEGRCQMSGCGCSPTPSLYRDPRGRQPRRWDLPRGAAAKGGGVPPKASGGAPSPRVPNPRRRGGPRGAHQPTRGWFPRHFSPWGPPGQVDPPGGPPEPLRWSRSNTGIPANIFGDRMMTSHI